MSLCLLTLKKFGQIVRSLFLSANTPPSILLTPSWFPADIWRTSCAHGLMWSTGFPGLGLSTNPSLNIPPARGAEALKKVVELRQVWKEKLAQVITGNKVSDDFLERLNTLLAEDTFHETLHRDGKKDFSLVRSVSQLDGEKLALAILARQIALFLAEANLSYLHRCANTTSCLLYFYDTTKNHRRQWCSVASCGNRHKVAQFRKRQGKVKK